MLKALQRYKGGKQKSPYIGAIIGAIIGIINTDYQQVRSIRKNAVNLLVSGRHHASLLESPLLLGSALSEQMLHLLSQVATTPKGIGAATSALAMAWATLKDVATCECIEVESLFESEVAFFEGALVEE